MAFCLKKEQDGAKNLKLDQLDKTRWRQNGGERERGLEDVFLVLSALTSVQMLAVGLMLINTFCDMTSG